jgi:hypothetical protein
MSWKAESWKEPWSWSSSAKNESSWTSGSWPPHPPAATKSESEPVFNLRPTLSYWTGKVHLILRHRLHGMDIKFEDLLESLKQFDNRHSQISSGLLWNIIDSDKSRYRVLTSVKALPSSSWTPPSRPDPPHPPPSFKHEPRTPVEEADEEAEEDGAQSVKQEILSLSSRSPSASPPPTRKSNKKHSDRSRSREHAAKKMSVNKIVKKVR